MGRLSYCFWIVTCGVGPKLWDGIKDCIRFHSWPLKLQIISGVCCSLVWIQTILALTLTINLFFLFDASRSNLGDYIINRQNDNFVHSSKDASNQISSVVKFSEWTLQKNAAVVNEILNPTYFNEYPVDIDATEIYTPERLGLGIGIDENAASLSYEMSTYAYTNGRTANTEYFARAFTAFNTLWKRQRLMYLGIDKNII